MGPLGPYGPGPYGPPGPLWAGPLWAGPLWAPWALMGQALGPLCAPWGLMGRALMCRALMGPLGIHRIALN